MCKRNTRVGTNPTYALVGWTNVYITSRK